jgi:hypothetical protein
LEDSDPGTWKTDTAKIFQMNSELRAAFGKSYDEVRANFSVESSLTKCLRESNSRKFFLQRRGIEGLLEDKEMRGELGPNILAGAMQANKINPTKGINKTIFVTEVLWRLLYLNARRV